MDVHVLHGLCLLGLFLLGDPQWLRLNYRRGDDSLRMSIHQRIRFDVGSNGLGGYI